MRMGTESSIALDALEAQFQAMRQVLADLEGAFLDAFAEATGGTVGSPLLASLRQAGCAVAAAIRAHPGKTMVLPYHNQYHFAEATIAMGRLSALAHGLGQISADDAALGVVAMVGHDIDHDGVSILGGGLEAHAAAKTARIARTHGVGEDALAWLADIIQGTDPAAQADNEARLAGALPPGPFGVKVDRLRSLANEADVMGSLMPALGLRLGEALARERRQAGDPAADMIASFAGRLAFLRRFPWFTEAATAFGIPCSVQAQIAAFGRAARALNAGATARDGAAALDRMEKDRAIACYLAELGRP
jgi:hypothetical protein